MMVERTVKDRLREEYFELLPEIRHVTEYLETVVRHSILPIVRSLRKYEHVSVKSRIKNCDSALEALRRRDEGKTFDQERPESYTLTSLRDLAGVRILAFPGEVLLKTDQKLRDQFPNWVADPIVLNDESDEPLAISKYYGLCDVSDKVMGEFQVVPTLIGLYWEVEHSVIYKAAPEFKYVARHPDMQGRDQDVIRALRSFEETLENVLK